MNGSEADTIRAMELLVATTNPGKLREIQEILAGLPVVLHSLSEWPEVMAPEETGKTFAENARLKALHYAGATGMLTVAEDSGLEIDALGGMPGVQSARFGGEQSTYPKKFTLIYQALDRVREAPRSARFVAALAIADGRRIVFETVGTVEGEIAPEPRGGSEFGYDPIFYYPPFGSTFAEAGGRKSSVSHRGKAFRHLRSWLSSHCLRSSPPP
jgi:XTP/dITP diphosphohydrolase